MSRYFALLIFSFFLPPAIASATVFKIATLSPEGSYWMNIMRAGADEVAQKTNNRVQIKFYPGGIMGDDMAVLRKIRIRQLQGGAITVGAVSQLSPDTQVYSLPMLFRDLEEVTYVRHKLDKRLLQELEQNGFVSFGLVEGGFAYIMSLSPIKSVSQLRSSKAWIPASDEFAMEAIKAYDVQPIPLPMGDVLTGLQTGLIDTVAAPPIVTIALHWHTQVHYLTDMPLLYSTGVLIIEKNAFNQLNKQDQQIMREVMGRVFTEIDERNRRDNKSAFTALQNQGIKLVEPDAAQLQEWRRYADAAIKQLVASGKISKNIVQTVEQYLAEYRAKKK